MLYGCVFAGVFVCAFLCVLFFQCVCFVCGLMCDVVWFAFVCFCVVVRMVFPLKNPFGGMHH